MNDYEWTAALGVSNKPTGAGINLLLNGEVVR